MSEIIYSDKLVEIHYDSILFRRYYFPLGSKKVAFQEIEKVEILAPTVKNGKWRIHGTGDFRTWFPFDFNRPSRDTIFLIYFNNRRRRIGFTVENSNAVKNVFKDKKLLNIKS